MLGSLFQSLLYLELWVTRSKSSEIHSIILESQTDSLGVFKVRTCDAFSRASQKALGSVLWFRLPCDGQTFFFPTLSPLNFILPILEWIMQ